MLHIGDLEFVNTINLYVDRFNEFVIESRWLIKLTPAEDLNSLSQRNRILELQKGLKDTGTSQHHDKCFGFLTNMFIVILKCLFLWRVPG